MPKKKSTAKSKDSLLREIAAAQPSSTGSQDHPVNVALMDPMAVYLCPDGNVTVDRLPSTADFKSFLNQALKEWGLSIDMLEAPIFFPRPTSSRSTVTSWQRIISSDASIPIPTIIYTLNMERGAIGRAQLLQRAQNAEKSHELLAFQILTATNAETDTQEKLDECMRTKKDLETRLALNIPPSLPLDESISEKIDRFMKEMQERESKRDAKAAVEKAEQDRKLAEQNRQLAELLADAAVRRAEKAEQDRQHAELLVEIAKSHESIANLQAAVEKLSRPMRAVRLRVLLEKYREWLSEKYRSRRPNETINGWLADIKADPALAEEDRRLIPLIFSGPGTIYGTLSDQHVHSAEEEEIADVVTMSHVHRDDFIRMFCRVFGWNPETRETVSAFAATRISE